MGTIPDMAEIDIDPGSLIALHALLSERHVTRAAKRLGLTQSSMSHRLMRLREALGDPLLVPVKGALALTPRAEAMRQPLEAALTALQDAVAPPARFDPRTSQRTFTIAMPDLLAPLLPALHGALTREAPGIDIRVTNVPPSLQEALATGTPDFALAPSHGASPSARVLRLGEVRFGVAARRGHPILHGKLSVERWLSYGHVVVRLGNQSPNLIGTNLERRGMKRRVAAEVPTFLAGLMLVAGSDLIMNAPLELMTELSQTLKLELREAPVKLPSVPAALLWHERWHHDEGHRWARERIHEAVRAALAS